MTFLQVARRLGRKGKFATALVKLKAAEEIAPPPGTLEDSSELKDRIKKELEIVKLYYFFTHDTCLQVHSNMDRGR